MATESAKQQDQNQTVIDTNEVPHRFYVKFRCGISASQAPMELIDQFREDLSDEMAFAIKKAINKKDKDGNCIYEGLIVQSQFKITSEIEWLDI